MKQFNLKDYLANPERKVVDHMGREVRIICTDRKGVYPVVALIKINDSFESLLDFTCDGLFEQFLAEYNSLYFADEVPDFKHYDRVLTRGNVGLPWKANLFSNFKKVGDNTIAVCLKGEYLLSDIIPFDEDKVGKIG